MIQRRVHVMVIIVLVVSTLCIYLPALNAQFLNWDDQAHLVNNHATQQLDIPHVKEAFTQVVQLVYMPLTTLSWTIERAIVGLNPMLYHATNIVIHAINACLVWQLALRLGLLPLGALMAVLLFAWHPMKVESVAWVTERKDVLCAMFYLLTLIKWVDYRRNSSMKNYAWVLLMAVLALLSKPMAISLPLVLLVMDWLIVKKLTWQHVKDKIIIFLCAIAIGWITYQHHVRYPIDDLLRNAAVFVYTIIFYPVKFFIPIQLTPIYTLPTPIGFQQPIYLVSLLAVLLSVITVVFLRKHRWLIFAVMFWVSSIFFLWRYDEAHDINIVADRFIYIPSIGACLALGVLAQSLHKKWQLIFLSGLIMLAVLSANQVRVWHDSITLFSHAIIINPVNTVALNDRAGAYDAIHRYDLAINDYDAILKFKPTDADTFMNRGLVFQAAGEHQQAVKDFTAVVGIYPNYARGYLKRGVSFLKLKQFDEAITDFTHTIHLTPDDADAYYNRGLAYLKQGKNDQALDEFNKAIKYQPNMAVAFNNRGVLYAKRHDYTQARRDFKQALTLDSSNRDAAFNLQSVSILEKSNDVTPQQVR